MLRTEVMKVKEMNDMKDLLQTGDWSTEKHVPVIELPERAGADQDVRINVSVGKKVPHPNTTAHHIAWIEVYFLPDGERFPYLIGRSEFTSHGSSAQGPDTSTVYTVPEVTLTLRTGKGGTVIALSYCNIHGLWTSTASLRIE
jgi:superoxide reductase